MNSSFSILHPDFLAAEHENHQGYLTKFFKVKNMTVKTYFKMKSIRQELLQRIPCRPKDHVTTKQMPQNFRMRSGKEKYKLNSGMQSENRIANRLLCDYKKSRENSESPRHRHRKRHFLGS